MKWTQEEDNYLINNYPINGPAICAEYLKRSTDSIRKRTSRLGIKYDGRRKWTPKEEELLRQYYILEGGPYCAQLLSRSISSIQQKAFRLNLVSKIFDYSGEAYLEKLIEKSITFKPVNIADYSNNHTNLKHVCLQGHIWSPRPADILQGSGCPTCSPRGFDSTKPATLYYLKISDGISIYYKIGITNRSLLERIKEIGIQYVQNILLEEKFEIGRAAKDKELLILQKYKENRSYCDFINSGNTEVFEFDVLQLDS